MDYMLQNQYMLRWWISMDKTYLDEIVDYPGLVILKLLENQLISDLLVNFRNADIDDLEDNDGNWKYFFDWDHIPETTQEVKAAFCIDTDIVSIPNTTTKRLELYVSVYCSQAYMKLNRQIFKGVKGNRINNLIRQADKTLRGSRDFGIGKLELKNVLTVTSGNTAFAKKVLTYSIPNFNLK